MRTAEVERDRDSETKWWELEVVVFRCAQNLVVLSARCLRDLRSVSASLVLTDPQVGEKSHQQRHWDMSVIEMGSEHLLLVVTIYMNTEQCLGLHR